MRPLLFFLFGFLGLALPAGADGERARLEARVENMAANRFAPPPDAPQGANWWHYDVVLRETTGESGITVEAWKKCYLDGELRICERVRHNVAELFGEAYIPKGGSLRIRNPAWVWAEKTGRTYGVVATYWARDDNGNRLQADYRFSVTSK